MTNETKSTKDTHTRILAGVGSNGFGQLVTILTQIAGVPLFLHSWGSSTYGQWLALTAIPVYLSISDLGLGIVAANHMTRQVASGDTDGALGSFQSAWACVTLITACLGLFAIPMIYLVDWASRLSVSAISPSEARLTLLVMTAYVLLGLHLRLITGAFRSVKKYALGNMLYNTEKMIEFFGIAIALALHGHPFQVALIYLGVEGVGAVVLWLALRSCAPWIKAGLGHLNADAVKKFAIPSIGLTVYWLADLTMVQGMTLLIGLLLGPIAVATFNTMRTLGRVLLQFSQMICWAVMPEVSAALGRQDHTVLRGLARRLMQMTIWTGLAIAAALGVAGGTVYHFWTGGRLPFDGLTFAVLVVSILANSIWLTSLNTMIAINRHSQASLALISAAILLFLCAWFLAQKMGLLGITLALVAAHAALIIYIVPLGIRATGDRLGPYVKSVSSPPFRDLIRIAYRVAGSA